MPTLSKADQAVKVSANEARRRKECALAELREIERDERIGRLIPAAVVVSVWAEILGSVKAAVLRIPDKCAESLAAVQDPREARNVLANEAEKILRNLADDIRRRVESGDPGGGRCVDAAAAGLSR
jgi:hypothetical protein